jgi:mono/diheme cytochrome c family protein
MEVPTTQRRRASGGSFAARALVVIALSGALNACGQAGSGRSIFRSSCSGCHTLSGSGARRTPGGDLLPYRMSRAQMIDFVSEMPVPRALSGDQVRTVSDYVLGLERAGPSRHG